MRLAPLLVLLAACGGDDGDDEPLGEPGTFTVTGAVSYEDRPQGNSGALGQLAPKPARGVQVAVVAESNGAVIAMTVADDAGAYSLVFDGFTGQKVHILAATTSTVATRPINVRHAANEKIHGFGGPTFDLASSEQNVLVTEASGLGEAFNIFDVLIDVHDQIPTLFPGRSPSIVDAFWHEGNTNGTYYFDNGLYLLGESSDSDGYDDTVILHEAGHWVEDVIGRSDSPGGNHDGSPTDPTLAWSEGFATYFAMAMTNKPIYADSNSGGGFAFNGDTSNPRKANAGGALTQPVSEDMVTQILWDMADAPASDDDGIAGTHVLVTSVEAFLKFASLRPVGTAGVDLVDALDGWFINNGLGTCAAMRTLVNTTHTFPYDYGSSAGACP
ncbi:MAG: hypothetical protein H0V17_34925 [Deltaproteobacteria bacterium]|nr:hypothetical protein [Deltaproteobacteria bacterium]